MWKTGVVFVFWLLVAGAAQAQTSTQKIRNSLLMPAENGARVIVNEQGDAGEVVRAIEAAQRPVAKIDGYRVRIFFDNSQDARSKANAAVAKFKELFRGIPAYPSYDNPSFKVTVGNCITQTEAVMLWGRVKGEFDKAFRVSEEIPADVVAE